MTREIRLNAFLGNGPIHAVPGLWAGRHRAHGGPDGLRSWTRLAQRLESGGFDSLVLFDHGPGGEAGTGASRHDPLMLVSALAHETQHLGLVVSASTAHEIPAVLARRYSSLDHLTGGRIGWHVVAGPAPHTAGGEDASRFARAEEFLSIVYRLWQGSWQPGAVVRDRESGIFARPEKIHRVVHAGQHFQLDTFHLTEPSPQRTPFLVAGSTTADERAFAARHAEAVFFAAPTRTAAARIARDIAELAEGEGRSRDDLRRFAQATIVTGSTPGEARAKLDAYRADVAPEEALAYFAEHTGEDLTGADPAAPVASGLRTEAGRAALEAARAADPARPWTLRDLAAQTALAAGGILVAGTPVEVADELEGWVRDSAIDGFNLTTAPVPEPFEDVVALVVPELQRHGALKRSYSDGTLREKVLGQPHPRPTHPATAFSGVPENASW